MVLILLIVSAVVFLHNLLKGGCANEIYSEVESPGNKYKAVAFLRDCGATTGFSTQISILNLSDVLKNSSGDVYITNGRPENVAPDMMWIDDRELVIKTELTGNEFKFEETWGLLDPVKITYSANGS